MIYSVKDLLKGAQKMSKSVFGQKSEYELQFNHEEDGCWYVDFPDWPFDHHNLMMVCGADRMCAALSDDDKHAYISVIPSRKAGEHEGYHELERIDYTITGGAYYSVSGIPGVTQIWLCPVTLFVLGHYPKYLYVKKSH